MKRLKNQVAYKAKITFLKYRGLPKILPYDIPHFNILCICITCNISLHTIAFRKCRGKDNIYF